ncbi:MULTISPECIES: SDR family oxidoreductase [unclassified Chelatococcus]|uniref:SDR family oxidoreductase n=1 Tax=unclassified Chelatococcus TaxID=2638111 RepID=UPI001BCFCCE4|nr:MULTISPECIES: SDR family oxidoreductase [unclassified Chelatococcus]CAH1656783.1 3-oxoacyl-(acyl-carrier protein) reductase [Hyphomicrobiales bacterium]MBS7740584.1 SDR family oxidoreductase [Chelatococcus sp. HY11]MBX3544632.1 SDR family oxidoreductase [Chelatococcus sp.]MCO5078173.1 SDR family oxidoreductase [Chelatococcus sp.]CAH1684632.1 3-oxoacyl-(acyl-carrier protein) reductase [Hyphomicrobiales bacterium]
MDLGLSGKRALVLGASRGLGAAIARTLAVEGADVVAASRNLDKITSWTEALPADVRARVTPAAIDLFDVASVEALATAMAAKGGVDILVNNSGGPPPATAQEAPRETWLKQFEAMAANLIHLTQLLLPHMQEQGWGRVITVASSGVEQPIPRLALSNGIRSALIGWSKTLSSEVAANGVTVNVVLPGRIATERIAELDSANAKQSGKSIEEVAKSSIATIPAGRLGDPQEFADVVAFLASKQASYVTGTKMRVDGGATRSV